MEGTDAANVKEGQARLTGLWCASRRRRVGDPGVLADVAADGERGMEVRLLWEEVD